MLKVRDFLADAVAALGSGFCECSRGAQLTDNQEVTFKGYSSSEAEALAVRLCEEVLGVKSYQWVLEPSMEIPPTVAARLFSSLRRLCAGEPLQYVLGYAYFCGFKFNVSPSVLIPRPETEELCRLVVQEAEGLVGDCVPRGSSRPVGENRCSLKIMDLCTGSGCVAWSLALLLPGAEVFGVDVSEEALSVARSQPLAEEAARRGAMVPKFGHADVLSELSHVVAPEKGVSSGSADGSCSDDFDIIVSNPPYVRESERDDLPDNVKNHEPALALFVPDSDPLIFYRAIANFSVKRLRTGGFGIVEINEAFGEPTRAIFSSAGFSSVNLLRDFRAKFRFVVFKK
ncbi:MAG: peptide chain release factor N(5)-glutamine methyltransferase [Bacteroidales bacterium]|nr:peptide chain release factor N(5)-glutamine methyltransferase [Bacteroidales bacterium]